jgi:hypothetical protein
MNFLSRGAIAYILLSFIGAFAIVFFYNQQPKNTDSFYHYNGAVNLATERGYVEDYLWVYLGAPDSLPAPSHLYWMPGTSFIASLGMFVFGTNYTGARIGLALCLWGAMLLAYWLGWYLGKKNRTAWLAGILTLFSGFFLYAWGQTDTFAPYAFFGAMALVFIGLGISEEKRNLLNWSLAGIFAACGHLIRSDGLLLLLVGWAVLLWPFERTRYKQRLLWLIPFTAAYILVMSPWFIRNWNEVGAILPVGGTQNAWFRSYDELFSYPVDASPATLFADGAGVFIESRLWATFSTNGILFQALAYEGAIIFAPLILIGAWKRRNEAFMRGILLFAIGIHIAFAWVFSFAGVRGGFWHASAALVPIWAVIGLLGLEDALAWIGQRRPVWKSPLATSIFSYALTAMVIVLSIVIAKPVPVQRPPLMDRLEELVPEGSRIMSVDPAEIYYYTGIGGIPTPNESPEVALELARLYGVDYLLLEEGQITEAMQFTDTPDFLQPINLSIPEVSLYAIQPN